MTSSETKFFKEKKNKDKNIHVLTLFYKFMLVIKLLLTYWDCFMS